MVCTADGQFHALTQVRGQNTCHVVLETNRAIAFDRPLIIGGVLAVDARQSEYSLKDESWSRCRLWNTHGERVDNECASFVHAADGRYILCVGSRRCLRNVDGLGHEKRWIACGLISVYDLELKTISVSSIDCPLPEHFLFDLAPWFGGVSDAKRDHLLVFGFVRECFQKYQSDVQRVPRHLIEAFVAWIPAEELHVIAFGDGTHCKMNVLDVLAELQPWREFVASEMSAFNVTIDLSSVIKLRTSNIWSCVRHASNPSFDSALSSILPFYRIYILVVYRDGCSMRCVDIPPTSIACPSASTSKCVQL